MNAKTNRGYTALHIAAEGDKTHCIPVLLQHGASTTELNDQGRTPLDVAIASGKTDAAQLLGKAVLANPLVQPTGQKRPAAD